MSTSEGIEVTDLARAEAAAYRLLAALVIARSAAKLDDRLAAIGRAKKHTEDARRALDGERTPA